MNREKHKFNINAFKELQEEKLREDELQNAIKSSSTLQNVTNIVPTKKRGKKTKKILRKDMSNWIADSWEQIKPSTIQNTAKHIGFTE